MADDNFRTLAILDLETTGLPAYECNRTKITQLSITACSVEHINELESKDEIPRVTHKLSLCFNPRKLIKLDVTKITGLSNELLEHESKFDENAADLIIKFLTHLQSPVLLVAHNGYRFDYPILKTQLSALNMSLPESIKCCDSLEIFRKIDEVYEQNSKVLINGYRLTSWEKLQDEVVAFIDSEILEIEAVLENYESDGEADAEKLEAEYFKLAPENKIDYLNEMKATERQKLNETTPNKPTKPENKLPSKSESNGENRKRNVHRELFPQQSSSPKKWPKGKYKLVEIYRRLFDEYPQNSHDAEADVLHLLKCIIACKKEFLELSQTMNINFCDVKEL